MKTCISARFAAALSICIGFMASTATAQSYIYYSDQLRPEAEGFTPYLEDRSGPFRSEYLQAARRWPDARACLTPDQQRNAEPDLSLVDWRMIRTRLDAEACLFRVLETLVTPQDGRRWIAAQGMENIRLRHLPTRQYSRQTVYDPHRRLHVRTVRTSRQIELCGTNNPNRSGRVLVRTGQTATSVSQYLYGGETFCARYSTSGILLSTSYTVKGLGDYPPDHRIQVRPIIKTKKYVARPLYRRRED